VVVLWEVCWFVGGGSSLRIGEIHLNSFSKQQELGKNDANQSANSADCKGTYLSPEIELVSLCDLNPNIIDRLPTNIELGHRNSTSVVSPECNTKVLSVSTKCLQFTRELDVHVLRELFKQVSIHCLESLPEC
jgi:hypothetical protein